MSNQINGGNVKSSSNQDMSLNDLLDMLKRHYLMVLVVTLLSLIIAGVGSIFIITPIYEAKTMLLVNQVAGSVDIQQNNMNTYVGQIKSDALMQRVINKMHLNNQNLGDEATTPRALAKQIKATAVEDSSLIEIGVSNPDPRFAAEIANTLSQEYMVFFAEKNQEIISRSVNFLEDQIAALRQELYSAQGESERILLLDTIALLRDKAQLASSIDRNNIGMTIVSPALEPTRPVKPNMVLNMALALLFGLSFSIALAFVKESLDNTIKTPEDVEKHLDLPVLGSIIYADRHARA